MDSFWFFYKNGLAGPRSFVLEPWGMEYSVPSGVRAEVFVRYDETGVFETEDNEKSFTIYLWTSCTAVFHLDGQVIGTHDEKVPAVPKLPQKGIH